MNEIITINLTPEFVIATAGAILSILFSYVPKLSTWFADHSEQFKQLFMLGLMILTIAVTFLLACYSFIVIDGFVCERVTIVRIGFNLLLWIVVNQSVYTITPKLQSVKVASAAYKDTQQINDLA